MEGVAQGDMLHPAVFCILCVPDLVHHRQRVSAVGIDRVIQAHRGADRIQGLAHILLGDIKCSGNLLQGGLPAQLPGLGFLALQHPVGHIPDGAADPDGTVVPQIPPLMRGAGIIR